MPIPDVVAEAGLTPNILCKDQAPAEGGRPRLEIHSVLVDSPELSTLRVPDPHYTVLMGGF